MSISVHILSYDGLRYFYFYFHPIKENLLNGMKNLKKKTFPPLLKSYVMFKILLERLSLLGGFLCILKALSLAIAEEACLW